MDWVEEWFKRWRAEGLKEDEFPWEELPVVFGSPNWVVVRCWRRTACENQPGLKMFYVWVKDENGDPLGDVHIEFDTVAPDTGVIYDHPNIWGLTGTRRGREGYAEWDHFGIPTRYLMYVDGELMIQNLRTDLGNEYCRPPGQVLGGWRPVNRPGIYSYEIHLRQKPLEEAEK